MVKYKIAMVVHGDQTEDVEGEDGAPQKIYAGISDDLKAALTALAQSAVSIEGVETEVDILDHEFANLAGLGGLGGLAPENGVVGSLSLLDRMPTLAIQFVLILIGFFFIRYFLKNSIIVPGDEEVVEEVKEIPAATLEDMRRQEVSAEIAQLSMDDPEAVAALLRSWMMTEEE